MLVLSRKTGESLMIGEHVELTVLGVEGDTVRIGIKAPEQIRVYRKEIYDMIQQSNQEASRSMVSPQTLNKIFKMERNSE
jgi:carbon storage regulator